MTEEAVSETPLCRFARRITREGKTVIAKDGATVEELHCVAVATVVDGIEGIDNSVWPEMSDIGVHCDVAGWILDERESAVDSASFGGKGGLLVGGDGVGWRITIP